MTTNKISWEHAQDKLLKTISEMDIEDNVYELAFTLTLKAISEVEKANSIEDDFDDATWYDDVRDMVMEEIYEKIRTFLN